MEVVYAEGLVGRIYVEGDTDTDMCHAVFERLRDTALPPKESRELITKTAVLGPGRGAGHAEDR